MNAAKTLTPKELGELLLNVAPVRPVFIWGPPGIGKSSIVQEFGMRQWARRKLQRVNKLRLTSCFQRLR